LTDAIQNKTLIEGLNALNAVIVDYKGKYTQQLFRMNDTLIPSLVFEYITNGRRNLGRNDGEIHTRKDLEDRKWLKSCC
jgi:hypothetical protein